MSSKLKSTLKRFKAMDYVALGILALFFLGFPLYGVAYRTSGDKTLLTVKRVVEQGGSAGKYLIFTENGEVFENTDSLLFGKFDSSDIQAELEVGKTYHVDIAGWRIPWLSMYRNVLDLTEVKEK